MNDILELKEKKRQWDSNSLNSKIYTNKSRTRVRTLYPKAERAEMCVHF